MGWMSETNGIVRDGVLKSLHCVENNEWESWSVGWEECSIMNPSLLNRLYSLSWLCMNCVLIIRIMSENGDELGVAHQPLDRSVSIVDREWVDLIIRITDWLGYGSEQWYQIVDCDDPIRFVNWVFSDPWLSMWIECNETEGMGLEITAFASDGWFKSSSIEWWWDERMNTWGLEGIGVEEAPTTTELDSTGW